MSTFKVVKYNYLALAAYWFYRCYKGVEDTYYRLRYGTVPLHVHERRYQALMKNPELVDEIKRIESVLLEAKTICQRFNVNYLEGRFTQEIGKYYRGKLYDPTVYSAIHNLHQHHAKSIDVLQLLVSFQDLSQRMIDFTLGDPEERELYYQSLTRFIHVPN